MYPGNPQCVHGSFALSNMAELLLIAATNQRAQCGVCVRPTLIRTTCDIIPRYLQCKHNSRKLLLFPNKFIRYARAEQVSPQRDVIKVMLSHAEPHKPTHVRPVVGWMNGHRDLLLIKYYLAGRLCKEILWWDHQCALLTERKTQLPGEHTAAVFHSA